MNIGYVIALQALYGTTLTVSKFLVALSPPIFLIGTRMSFAGSLLMTYQYIKDKKKLICFDKKLWPYLIKISIFNIYIPYVLRYWSLTYLSVGKTALFFNLTPLISYIISYLMGLQKQCPKKWFSIALGFIGFLPMIMSNPPSEACAGPTIGFLSLPEIAMFLAMVSLSYSLIIVQRASKTNLAPPFVINGISMFIGGIMALSTSYFATTELIVIKEPATFAIWLAYIIIVTNVIFYTAQAILLKHFSTTIFSLASLAAPLFATLTSVLFLGETVSWEFFFSAIMLSLSVYLFHRTEPNKNSLPKSPIS